MPIYVKVFRTNWVKYFEKLSEVFVKRFEYRNKIKKILTTT